MFDREPVHADADLILKLYDLRRETVMRESRKKMLAWMPRDFADVEAILDMKHPDNAAYRQVGSYFEMAYGFARHGVVHPELLAENTGEGLILFAKIEPFLAEYRERFSPAAFQNAEWIATQTEAGRQRLDRFRKFVNAAREKAGAGA